MTSPWPSSSPETHSAVTVGCRGLGRSLLHRRRPLGCGGLLEMSRLLGSAVWSASRRSTSLLPQLLSSDARPLYGWRLPPASTPLSALSRSASSPPTLRQQLQQQSLRTPGQKGPRRQPRAGPARPPRRGGSRPASRNGRTSTLLEDLARLGRRGRAHRSEGDVAVQHPADGQRHVDHRTVGRERHHFTFHGAADGERRHEVDEGERLVHRRRRAWSRAASSSAMRGCSQRTASSQRPSWPCR